MISFLNLLFPLVLALTSPTPTTTAAATGPVKCICQDIGHKSW